MTLPTVLVVDDDPLIRGYLRMALEGLPIDVVLAAGFAEGRARLDDASWALLVTDVTMGDGDGLELVALAARQKPPLRSIVLSADASAATDERARALGAWRVLVKPVSVAALLASLREALLLPPAPPRAVEPAGLIDEFRAACAAQFRHDIDHGDRALTADPAGLGTLAHNLRSVLAILGEAEAASVAARLDESIRVGKGDRDGLWRELRGRLDGLAEAARVTP